MHGKTSSIQHDGKGIFKGVSKKLTVVRYHSLAVEPKTLPPVLRVSARSEDGTLMGIRHRSYPTEGLQFHPESLMTDEGKRLLKNFLGKRR
jgi:anthranilate synthase/aminodeoxychorismate synthase-like glutamine amidotransferase